MKENISKLNNQQLTAEYMTDYTARIKGKKRSWQPDDLITLPFADIVKFVHDARQFEVVVITDSQYPDLLKLDQYGLDDESLAEVFLPLHTRKYETMAGHSVRRRILLEGGDLLELCFKDLVVLVGKARDFGEKHLANALDISYLRSIGFLPVVKNASKVQNGIVLPDNVEKWFPR